MMHTGRGPDLGLLMGTDISDASEASRVATKLRGKVCTPFIQQAIPKKQFELCPMPLIRDKEMNKILSNLF